MSVVTTLYVIHTPEHGLEPKTFNSYDEGVCHMNELSELGAYKKCNLHLYAVTADDLLRVGTFVAWKRP